MPILFVLPHILARAGIREVHFFPFNPVLSFNGKPVKNLKSLAKMVESCKDDYLKFDLEYQQGSLVRRSDVLGLIMRCNELAHDIMKAAMTQQLPPMLLSLNMCKSCRHLDTASSALIRSSGWRALWGLDELQVGRRTECHLCSLHIDVVQRGSCYVPQGSSVGVLEFGRMLSH
ncbi:hypothetical protein Droror1_Dr00018146 [Drosera rotundifolia]